MTLQKLMIIKLAITGVIGFLGTALGLGLGIDNIGWLQIIFLSIIFGGVSAGISSLIFLGIVTYTNLCQRCLADSEESRPLSRPMQSMSSQPPGLGYYAGREQASSDLTLVYPSPINSKNNVERAPSPEKSSAEHLVRNAR